MFNGIRVSSLAITLGAALLAAAAVPRMRASEIDRRTTFSFSAPVEIDGQTLPAGTYVFRTLDQDRDLVMVTNSNGKHVYGVYQTIPIQAATVPDKTRVEFSEAPLNAPEPIHAWFYPGQNLGWEFPNPNR